MIIIDARREKNPNRYPVTASIKGDIKSKNVNMLDRQSNTFRLVELFGDADKDKRCEKRNNKEDKNFIHNNLLFRKKLTDDRCYN